MGFRSEFEHRICDKKMVKMIVSDFLFVRIPLILKKDIEKFNFLKKMFKNFLIYISVLTLLVSCSSGNKPYFWEAEKDGKTSYFLGTFHHGISLDELLCSDTILERLKNSDLVLTELGDTIIRYTGTGAMAGDIILFS